MPTKKIMLVNIYDGLYGGDWVGLAPYVLKAYAGQFEVSKSFDIATSQFGRQDSVGKIVRKIKSEDPDAVGFSLYVYNIRKTLDVIKQLDCIVIVGGPQVTGVEKDLLAGNRKIDIVVTGEGEKAFKELLEYFAGLKKIENIPGTTTRSSQVAPSIEMIDLNKIPPVHGQIVRDHPRAENICIETSRGCPYRCGYCAWAIDKKMRYYDMGRILGDFETICRQPGIKNIYLADASLFFNKERAKTVLAHIIKLSPKKKFYFELNLEHVDDELIDLMAQLPNQDFSFGIQAVDPEPNEKAGRSFDPILFRERFQRISGKLRKAQLLVDIIYPLPGDTLEGCKRSIEFALSLDKVHLIKFNPLILLPGSEFFRNRERYGFKLRDDVVRTVEACNTFLPEDVKQAIKYANYTCLIQANSKFKSVIRLAAKKKNIGMLEYMDELVQTLPFDLFDGGELPEMITAERDDEKYFLGMVPAYLNYGRLIKHFKEHTRHEYDHLLAGWITSFGDLGIGKMGPGSWVKVLWALINRRLAGARTSTVTRRTAY
ncbi:B12-binding domain-containing radical SAM protein [candidate division TA06 bacterium]|nr:B12-binding domain-containing radical SAM protein [candidate division TA06 bacterium]